MGRLKEKGYLEPALFNKENNELQMEAEIETYHGTAGKMLRNKRYLGDGYYPTIIDKETFEKAEEERARRAKRLGRIFEPKQIEKINALTGFIVGEVTQKYINPFKQAEYAYSLIESEVDLSDSQ